MGQIPSRIVSFVAARRTETGTLVRSEGGIMQCDVLAILRSALPRIALARSSSLFRVSRGPIASPCARNSVRRVRKTCEAAAIRTQHLIQALGRRKALTTQIPAPEVVSSPVRLNGGLQAPGWTAAVLLAVSDDARDCPEGWTLEQGDSRSPAQAARTGGLRSDGPRRAEQVNSICLEHAALLETQVQGVD